MRHSQAKRRLLSTLRREVYDQRVLDAIAAVPREAFVLPQGEARAYENAPMPIGQGQTISQPLILAIMLEAMELRWSDSVLEVGTGSGYGAALLSRLVARVVTVERIPALEEQARGLLQRLGCGNVTVHLASEVLGWPDGAPYDAVVVAAAAPSVPQELVDQVKIGGHLVVPVGTPFEQTLTVVHRTEEHLDVNSLGGCRFVPLIGPNAWESGLPEAP